MGPVNGLRLAQHVRQMNGTGSSRRTTPHVAHSTGSTRLITRRTIPVNEVMMPSETEAIHDARDVLMQVV
jgi:hypothetical protein